MRLDSTGQRNTLIDDHDRGAAWRDWDGRGCPMRTARTCGSGGAEGSRSVTSRRRSLDRRKEVNAANARQRGPGERVNAELQNWRILRKIRSSPNRASALVAAIQTLMIANA